MKTQHNAHMPMPASAEESLSAWWDNECVPTQAHQVDRLLSVAGDDARQSLRCYSLIGAALRQEHLDSRDISALVSARLAEDEGEAQRLVQDIAHTSPQSGRVLSFPQSAVRRSMNRWRGAIAASFVAGLVGVGIWMMPQNSPENVLMQQAGNGLLENQQAGATNGSALEQSVQALPVVARVTPGAALPAWARKPVSSAPMNPYLMTHFESVSPDLSEVMPSLRMTSFHTE